jgi:hypothetical protein
MEVVNTVAYYAMATITAVKNFYFTYPRIGKTGQKNLAPTTLFE